MPQPPTFTIVTPSFNQGAFIDATLQSIRAQSFQDYEHLIYDPGSTDGSVEQIRVYCKQAEQAEFILGRDKSQTNAINLGFSRARGEILCWLNSDDTYHDADVLAKVAAVFNENPDVDVVYGRGQYVSPEGDVLREAYINRDGSNIFRQMSQSLGILQPSLFIRRRVFEKAGPLDEVMNFSFDYEYWVRCASLGCKFQFLDQLLSRAVIHDDAKTMRARNTSLNESLQVARRYYKFVAVDWAQRLADYRLNTNDGIINTITNEAALNHETRVIFEEENANSEALSRYFNADPLMDEKTQKSFSELVSAKFKQVYLSGWDKNYFDMGVTLIASLQRTDPSAFIFVYDLGMSADQIAFLKLLDGVILLEHDFVPYEHAWQRHPKNYVFKITLFNHLLSWLPRGCKLLWVDAGVMIVQRPDEIFSRLDQDGVFFIDHDDSRHWPLYNASFTSDAAIRAGRFTYAELAGPHVCSCLFGTEVGRPEQKIFAEAAKLASDREVAVGDKHPPESEKISGLPKPELRERAKDFSALASPAGNDLEPLRAAFGYFGHRQDQSIISLLATRHNLPISSAAYYCPANDESSQVSRENWFEGISSTLGGYASTPSNQSGIAFHHRGLVKDFSGLRFYFKQNPIVGILGNGPSLAEIDLTELHGIDTVGMNAAYRFWEQNGWYPSFYSCLDTVVGMSHKEEIRNLIRARRRLGIKAFLLRQNLVDWLAETGDLDGVINFDLVQNGVRAFLADPVTTGSHSLAWCDWMGYKKGFVAGVDCNYVEKVKGAKKTNEGTLKIEAGAHNPNYFFDGYQQVGDTFNIPNPSKDLHIRSWRNVAKILHQDFEVYNVSSISKMDALPKLLLKEALKRFGPSNFREAEAKPQCFILSATDNEIEKITDLAALPGRLGQEKYAIIVYDDPADLVAQALARSEEWSTGLKIWEDNSHDILSFFRRTRSQITLLQSSDLAEHPVSFEEMLQAKLPNLNFAQIAVNQVCKPDPLLYGAACLMLKERPRTQKLLNELQASSYRQPATHAPDAKDLCTAYNRQELLKDAQAEISRLSASKDGVLSQHSVLKEQLNAAQVRAEELYEKVRTSEQQKQDNEHLHQSQRQQLQAAVEFYHRKMEELQTELQHSKQEQEQREAEIAALLRSRSWRITRPLRWLRRATSSPVQKTEP